MQLLQTGQTIQVYVKSQDKYKIYKLGKNFRVGVGCVQCKAHNIKDESDAISVKKEKEISLNPLELYKQLENLRFDNVVNILFVQKDLGKSYFIGMDQDDGSITELFYQLQKEGHPYKKLLPLIEQMIKYIANGLSLIHGNKIIHRDLKPDNVFYKKNEDQYCFMIQVIRQNQVSCNVKQTLRVESPTINIQQVQNQILEFNQDNIDHKFYTIYNIPVFYQKLLKRKKRIDIKQVLEYLDQQQLEQASQNHFNANHFSQWDYFKQNIHPDLKTKLLDIQTKLRPLFVNQKDLIYQVLIKIGEDLKKEQYEQYQNQQQEKQIKNNIKFQDSEKKIIIKHTMDYFKIVLELFISKSKEQSYYISQKP